MDEEPDARAQQDREARREATLSRWGEAQRNFGAAMFCGMAAIMVAWLVRALASAGAVNALFPGAAQSPIPGVLYAGGVAGVAVGMVGIAFEGYRFSRTAPGPGLGQVMAGAVLMTGMALLVPAILFVFWRSA